MSDDPKEPPPEVVVYSSPKAPSDPVAASHGSNAPAGALSPAGATTAPTTALARTHAKAQEKNLAVVQRADRKLRRQSQATLSAVLRAPEIDPDSPVKPEGWTDKEWRIARASWANTREVPAFVAIAEKVYGTFRRAEAQADRDPSPTLNADIQVFVQQNVYHYETVEGDEHK